ncbi:MAG: leader peptidase (prepilin peptidase) / N-methyltransferase [Acidimicrobiaceae bacterium]|jgi:leader peptidase (prepilin peptidase)/N-methyltransferase|nr:leader peptidase (prepilin peptidase) / N-methyltransferase [Acidimicrobiaceae bacterium]
MLLAAVGCGVLGILIGSFLNVLIHRVPIGESIVSPPSACPNCHTPISPRDNIPIVSWLVLRGRCRHCHTRISARYPFVEALTGALFAVVGARFGFHIIVPAVLVFTAASIALAAIDLEHRRLPDRIVFPTLIMEGALLVLAGLIDHRPRSIAMAAVGAVIAGGFLFVVWFAVPKALGFGDVKYGLVFGALLGWFGLGHVVIGLFLGYLCGSVIGIGMMIVKRKARGLIMPFGPSLALGAWIAALWGTEILDWYRNLLGG